MSLILITLRFQLSRAKIKVVQVSILVKLNWLLFAEMVHDSVLKSCQGKKFAEHSQDIGSNKIYKSYKVYHKYLF